MKRLKRIDGSYPVDRMRQKMAERLRFGRNEYVASVLYVCPEERAVVSEFVNGRSVEWYLEDNQWRRGLQFKQRLQLLLDAAEGLGYLHTLQPAVMHFDVKPGNILLTQDLRGKLVDVGVAALIPELKEVIKGAATPGGKRPVGTKGYVDP